VARSDPSDPGIGTPRASFSDPKTPGNEEKPPKTPKKGEKTSFFEGPQKASFSLYIKDRLSEKKRSSRPTLVSKVPNSEIFGPNFYVLRVPWETPLFRLFSPIFAYFSRKVRKTEVFEGPGPDFSGPKPAPTPTPRDGGRGGGRKATCGLLNLEVSD
jgi:hypothetical protein